MTLKEQVRCGLWAVRHSFRLTGRSTRTDLVYYLGTCLLALLGLVLLFLLLGLLGLLRSGRAGEWMDALIETAPTVPLLGLLARRLNDQDRSRWWLIAWPPGVLGVLIDEAAEEKLVLAGIGPSGLDALDDTLFCPLLVLLFLPGIEGPNRYGPDPRGRQSGQLHARVTGGETSL